MQDRRIHIYQGSGKGKTTAALGLLLRAVGADYRVGFASFIKGGDSSELPVLRTLPNVTVFPFLQDVPFTFQMTAEQRAEATAFYTKLLAQITKAAALFDLIVLDEVLDAVDTALIPEDMLVSLCAQRPCELVLTGRKAPQRLSDLADYITDMQAVRHPFERGLPARRGIEY